MGRRVFARTRRWAAGALVARHGARRRLALALYWYHVSPLQLQPPFVRRRAGGLDSAAPLARLHLEASLGVLEQWSLATVCDSHGVRAPLSRLETGVACSPRGEVHMSAELLPHICVVCCDLPSWYAY